MRQGRGPESQEIRAERASPETLEGGLGDDFRADPGTVEAFHSEKARISRYVALRSPLFPRRV
jgi:hypothetical protein